MLAVWQLQNPRLDFASIKGSGAQGRFKMRGAALDEGSALLKTTRVDGRNPVDSPVDMVNIPLIYRVLYIPGGCLGFLPSTV